MGIIKKEENVDREVIVEIYKKGGSIELVPKSKDFENVDILIDVLLKLYQSLLVEKTVQVTLRNLDRQAQRIIDAQKNEELYNKVNKSGLGRIQ
jgi:hypothetical protein